MEKSIKTQFYQNHLLESCCHYKAQEIMNLSIVVYFHASLLLFFFFLKMLTKVRLLLKSSSIAFVLTNLKLSITSLQDVMDEIN